MWLLAGPGCAQQQTSAATCAAPAATGAPADHECPTGTICEAETCEPGARVVIIAAGVTQPLDESDLHEGSPATDLALAGLVSGNLTALQADVSASEGVTTHTLILTDYQLTGQLPVDRRMYDVEIVAREPTLVTLVVGGDPQTLVGAGELAARVTYTHEPTFTSVVRVLDLDCELPEQPIDALGSSLQITCQGVGEVALSLPACGDGVLSLGEECDDGNDDDDDQCVSCRVAIPGPSLIFSTRFDDESSVVPFRSPRQHFTTIDRPEASPRQRAYLFRGDTSVGNTAQNAVLMLVSQSSANPVAVKGVTTTSPVSALAPSTVVANLGSEYAANDNGCFAYTGTLSGGAKALIASCQGQAARVVAMGGAPGPGGTTFDAEPAFAHVAMDSQGGGAARVYFTASLSDGGGSARHLLDVTRLGADLRVLYVQGVTTPGGQAGGAEHAITAFHDVAVSATGDTIALVASLGDDADGALIAAVDRGEGLEVLFQSSDLPDLGAITEMEVARVHDLDPGAPLGTGHGTGPGVSLLGHTNTSDFSIAPPANVTRTGDAIHPDSMQTWSAIDLLAADDRRTHAYLVIGGTLEGSEAVRVLFKPDGFFRELPGEGGLVSWRDGGQAEVRSFHGGEATIAFRKLVSVADVCTAPCGDDDPTHVALLHQALPSPVGAVDTEFLAFQDTFLGTSTTEEVVVTSTGQETLVITDASVTSFGDVVFSVDVIALPRRLAPGATLRIPLRFTPESTTTHSGILFIDSDVGRAGVSLVGSGVGCTADSDCPSTGNECMLAHCDVETGYCSAEKQPDGVACGDGEAECVVFICFDGECDFISKPDGGPCTGDGDACTLDLCSGGVCTHEPRLCPHDDQCLIGSCDPETGECLFDLKVCPETDCMGATCDALDGTCVPIPRLNGTPCGAGGDECVVEACVDGLCTSAFAPTGTPCADDGDLCSEDVCLDGRCDHPDKCVSVDPCQIASCEPATGDCSFSPRVCPDDGNACTEMRCEQQTGECVPVPLEGCDGDPNPCAGDVCDSDPADVLPAPCLGEACDPPDTEPGPVTRPNPGCAAGGTGLTWLAFALVALAGLGVRRRRPRTGCVDLVSSLARRVRWLRGEPV